MHRVSVLDTAALVTQVGLGTQPPPNGRLEHQYLALLAYYPTNPAPGWHTLDVTLRGVRGDVTARHGYWVALPARSSK